MPEPLLSVVVNTLNAAKYLEAALRSAQGIADDLVVVDMHSDDATREIAERFGARIFLHPRTGGYVEPARNFAIGQARGTWVLVLDADERLDDGLRRNLRGFLNTDPEANAFTIVFRTLAAGRWLRGTGWGPDREQHLRLFRRGHVHWPPRIHSLPKVSGQVEALPIPGAAIEHLNFPELRDFVARLEPYSGQEMQALAESGIRWTPERMLSDAVEELYSRYQPQLDGVHSLVFASFMAFYRFLTWARLWEREGCPDAELPPDPDALFRKLARLARGQSHVAEGVSAVSGAWNDEGGWRWLQRTALLRVDPDRLATPARLSLGFLGPPARAVAFPLVVSVRCGSWASNLRLGPEASGMLEVPLAASTAPVDIQVECSSAFVPERVGLGSDGRELAVRLQRVEWGAAS